jgi:hypothetical protein
VVFSRVPGGLWLGIPLVLLVAAAELTDIPFMNHHGRKQFWGARLLVIGFLTTTPLAVAISPRYAWDVVFFWTAGYSLFSWTAMTDGERQQVREAVVTAKAKLVAEEIARARPRPTEREGAS